MSAPWEKYQSAEQGPWTAYQDQKMQSASSGEFAENEGGAAFGRPINRGKVNTDTTPRPLQSFMAGATKSMVTDPVLGAAQLVSGGNAGTDAAKRIQDEYNPYAEENPMSAMGGQIFGAVAPLSNAGRVVSAGGRAIGQIPSMANATAAALRTIPPKIAPYVEKVATGLGYGALGSAMTPDVKGENAQEVRDNRLDRGIIDTLTGGAIPAVTGAVKPLISGAGKLGSELVGMTTGTSGDAIREAYKAGKKGTEEFVENMRGRAPITDLLESAQSALSTMKQARKDAFKEGFESTKKNQVFLDFAPIEDKFKNTIKDLNYTGVGGVQVSKVGKKTSSEIGEIQKLINEWKSKPEVHTAEGLDSLKRRIDDLWSNDMSKEAKSVLTQTRGAVKNTIVKQDKNYAKTMRDYEDSLSIEREIEKALSLGDNAAADTAIRKLQSLGRNNANTNYGYRQQLADVMRKETGVDLMPALSGQALNTLVPRGLAGKLTGTFNLGAGAVNPMFWAGLPFQSPRAMGEAAYAMGKGAKSLDSKLSNKNKRLAQLLMQESFIKNGAE